jgi:hypothetical protein
MKHVQLFENFDTDHFFEFLKEFLKKGFPASKLSSKSYWSKFDYDNGSTALQWQDDPGYQALPQKLETDFSSILVYNSEETDVEKLEDFLENKTRDESIPSTQNWVSVWDYFPKFGIAVAYGGGGAPDWYFISPSYMGAEWWNKELLRNPSPTILMLATYWSGLSDKFKREIQIPPNYQDQFDSRVEFSNLGLL